MNLHLNKVESLANIDLQLDDRKFTPTEYEMIRKVILNTGDFEYSSILCFSRNVFSRAIEALRMKKEIIVDVPTIQVEIVPRIRQTFQNLVYCAKTQEITSNNSQELTNYQTKEVLGLEKLAQLYPTGMYVIGQEEIVLETFSELIEEKKINPSLAIITPPKFKELNYRQLLEEKLIPYIAIDSSKGGAIIAATIINEIVNLSWLDYQNDRQKNK